LVFNNAQRFDAALAGFSDCAPPMRAGEEVGSSCLRACTRLR